MIISDDFYIALPSSSNKTKLLYVVTVDSRGGKPTCAISNYSEGKCDADYFQKKIVQHPKMKCFSSRVAAMCGLDLKIYFMKAREGLAHSYREGGESGCKQAFAMNPDFLSNNNNGSASWLTIDPKNGLPEWTVLGKAYIVWNDGTGPLSKGQVWGIQEMVQCSLDLFGLEVENMELGCRALQEWSKEYQKKTWEPPSGLGRGRKRVDIYSSRSD